MATLVSFHAHPDDESIIAAGVLRRAADEGHRVVLVFATRGELGEVEDGFLVPTSRSGSGGWPKRRRPRRSSARPAPSSSATSTPA